LDKARLAEDEAFRRLIETPDLGEWHESLGAWLRTVRTLQQEKWLARILWVVIFCLFWQIGTAEAALAPYKRPTNQVHYQYLETKGGNQTATSP
jgi:hypothetical protein